MESKYIEATKRYYEELEKISMPTPIEKTARDLFLSIIEEIQECFSIEQGNPEKYDRLYTLLLSLLDFDLQYLLGTWLSLSGVNSSALLKVIPLADKNKINVLKRFILRYVNTPNTRKEFFDYTMGALSEQCKLNTHELLELLFGILFYLAIVCGRAMVYNRTIMFIYEKREKIKDKEEVYAIIMADEADDIKIESLHDCVVDNFGNDDDIKTIKIAKESFRIINDLKNCVTVIEFLTKLNEGLLFLFAISVGNFLYNHDNYSQQLSKKEIQILDSIVHQPFMEDFIGVFNKWVAEDKAQKNSLVEQAVKEIPSSDKNKKTKDKLESLLRPSTTILWEQASEVFDKAIEEGYITWDGVSEYLTWTREGLDFEYMCGILFCRDYRKKANKTNTWAKSTLKDFPQKALTSTIQLCEEKAYKKQKKTTPPTKWGEQRRSRINKKDVPASYEVIESLFSNDWQTKYNHQIVREE